MDVGGMCEHYDDIVNEVDLGKRGIYVSVVPLDHDIAQEEGGGPEKSLRQPLLADQHAINHPPRPVSPEGKSKILTGVIDMYHTFLLSKRQLTSAGQCGKP